MSPDKRTMLDAPASPPPGATRRSMRYLTFVCLVTVAALAMPWVATASPTPLSSENGDAS